VRRYPDERSPTPEDIGLAAAALVELPPAGSGAARDERTGLLRRQRP
jgi:hypothetical protein